MDTYHELVLTPRQATILLLAQNGREMYLSCVRGPLLSALARQAERGEDHLNIRVTNLTNLDVEHIQTTLQLYERRVG